MENGQEEKAAAIAIFFLKMKKALEILSTSAARTRENGECGLCPLCYCYSISSVRQVNVSCNMSENGECGLCYCCSISSVRQVNMSCNMSENGGCG